ncbi:MAG: hypothetical protein VR78_04090 [Hoeflea sp. BRH_c9]|nr:MAG: hypothetical protein VR78_04090 [Hoeflea sp. BRH_c9]
MERAFSSTVMADTLETVSNETAASPSEPGNTINVGSTGPVPTTESAYPAVLADAASNKLIAMVFPQNLIAFPSFYASIIAR